MRLGELRTKINGLDNKLFLKLSVYDDVKGVRIFDIDWDMSNDSEVYLRLVEEEN